MTLIHTPSGLTNTASGEILSPEQAREMLRPLRVAPRRTTRRRRSPWITKRVKQDLYLSVACFCVIFVVVVGIEYPM